VTYCTFPLSICFVLGYKCEDVALKLTLKFHCSLSWFYSKFCSILIKLVFKVLVNNDGKCIAKGKTYNLIQNLTFIGSCIMIYFYSKTNEMHQFLKFILVCSSTLHVSDGLSVHHQEPTIVHTASGVCQTGSGDCLLAGKRCSISFPLASSQQNLFDIYLMLYVQS
jgi:hypothetical protein